MLEFLNRRSSSLNNIYINNSGYKIEEDQESLLKSNRLKQGELTSDFGVGFLDSQEEDQQKLQIDTPSKNKHSQDEYREIDSTQKRKLDHKTIVHNHEMDLIGSATTTQRLLEHEFNEEDPEIQHPNLYASFSPEKLTILNFESVGQKDGLSTKRKLNSKDFNDPISSLLRTSVRHDKDKENQDDGNLKEAIDLDDNDLQTSALEQGMRDRVKRIGKTIIMQKDSPRQEAASQSSQSTTISFTSSSPIK